MQKLNPKDFFCMNFDTHFYTQQSSGLGPSQILFHNHINFTILFQ